MSAKQPSRRSQPGDDRQALADMYRRPQEPLSRPPRLLDRPRVVLDDVAGPRRTPARAWPAGPAPGEQPDPPEPVLPPLVEASADLRLARTIAGYESPARSVHRIPTPRYSFFEPVHARPGLVALIALISIIVIVLTQAQEGTVLSKFINRSLPHIGQVAAPTLPETPPGEHSLLGRPTISAETVDAVLAKYGSPAAGTGKIWIELGRRYNIDPAYALAFFIHESSAGTNPGWAGLKPDGSTTHNIGNIICAGYSTCFGRFRDYRSWEEGIEDWYRLIAVEYVQDRRAHTLEQIIPIYAPAVENNVPAYVQAVVSLVDEWRGGGQ